MLDTDSEHMQLSGEPCPRSVRYCHLAGTVHKPSKGHSIIQWGQVFQDDGKHAMTNESQILDPLLYLFGYEVSYFIKNSDV